MKKPKKFLGIFGSGEPSLKNHNVTKLESVEKGNSKFKLSEKSTSNQTQWYIADVKSGTDIKKAIQDVSKESGVISAQPDYIRKIADVIPDAATDPQISDQWYLNRYGIKEAWNNLNSQGINPGGKRTVVVAVIDTGVDYTHQDLSANMWTNTGEIPGNGIDDDNDGYVDDIHGACVVGDKSGNPMDDNGHGTHVAGIIAAQAGNSTGGAGVAYNVQIMAIKAAQSSGVLSSSDIAQAILYAADKGADVINMSFGGYEKSSIEEDALQTAFGTSVLVAAAGNDSMNNEDSAMYPAAYPWVIGAMAERETPAANGDNLADFSNWDGTPDNQTEYEVMAPGVNIMSTLPGNTYAKWSGTSMAAPVVSGIAALVRSKYSDKTTYNSRFIMGQVVGTGPMVQGITPQGASKAIYYREVNAYDALNNTPKPQITVGENYLFDSKSIDSNNNGNGIIDAGETVDIAQVIRNHWGKADNVNVTLDANPAAGIPDPYVTLVNNTVNYGAVGNFGSDDNGLIYDSNKVITGVSNPFRIKVADNTPNDHVIKLNVTVTANNGFDSNDSSVYASHGTISYTVRHTTELPRIIDHDMTLTKDNYWLIPDKTLIESGVTVNVEPGAQIQFWSTDPSDPYSEQQIPYLQVEGNFEVNGSADDPVQFFTGLNYKGYEIKICNAGSGKTDLKYAKLANPDLNVTTVDHCYFYQDLEDYIYYRFVDNGKIQTNDWRSPYVLSDYVSNTRFYKVGYTRFGSAVPLHLSGDNSDDTLCVAGNVNNNIFDSCIMNFNVPNAQNNVFLKNSQVDSYYHNIVASTAQNWGQNNLDTQRFMLGVFPVQYNGETYIGVIPNCILNGYNEMKLVEKYAESFGGHIVTINDAQENQFLQQYAYNYLYNDDLIQKTYPNTCYMCCGYPSIGYNDYEQTENFKWISGEDSTYTNWDYGQPASGTGSHIAQLEIGCGCWITNNNYSPGYEFIIEVPGTMSQSDIDAKRADFMQQKDVIDIYNTVYNNAILNDWSDPDVTHWIRFISSGIRNINNYLSNNYWGSATTELIDKCIEDYNDDFNTAKVIYDPILTTAPETAYPFVADAYVSTASEDRADKVGAEKITLHVTFNRDMNQTVQPQVSFGPDDPTTDYPITGSWTDARHWSGDFLINPITGDGYQYIRVAGAQAADDPWLVTGNDAGRFKFEIVTSGTESMNLQADGQEGKVYLSWTQNDFDLLAGYNVYRSDSADGTFTKINSTIIPKDQKYYYDTTAQPGKVYYYKFTVLKTDLTESDFSNVASAAALDTVPPVISHTPVTAAAVGLSLQIYADITDNVGIKSAVLYYRNTGTKTYSQLPMINAYSSRYSATIDGSYAKAPGIDYYIEATDGVSVVRNGSPDNPDKVVITDAPKITSITPSNGPDSGGTAVNVTGTNFKNGAVITFDGAIASDVAVQSSSSITAVTPAHFPASVDVTVTNPDGYKDTMLRAFSYTKTGVDVSVPDSDANLGDTFEIPITIGNVSGLNSVDMQLNYDKDVLTAQSVRVGSLTSNYSISANTGTAGQVNISMASANQTTGSGVIAYVTFKVAAAPQNTSCPVTISSLKLNGGNITGNIINGTFTVSQTHSIHGSVNYYSNNNPVSGVNMLLKGDKSYTSSSINDGSYSISDIAEGNYSLTASKNDEADAITAYDASLILQASSGLIGLSSNQSIAADVNGDGKVDAVDASYVLKEAAGLISLPFTGSSRIWTFAPAEKDYTNLSGDVYNENFTAILIGDVSGNWHGAADPSVKTISSAVFKIGDLIKNSDGTVSIPVNLRMDNGKLFGSDIIVYYNTAAGTPVSVENQSISSNFGIAYNLSTPGVIRISMAGSQPVTGAGNLIKLNFNSADSNALMAGLTIKQADVNEKMVGSVIYKSTNVNNDKSIDIIDLAAVAQEYNLTDKDTANWNDALDINCDGRVDIFDLVEISKKMTK